MSLSGKPPVRRGVRPTLLAVSALALGLGLCGMAQAQTAQLYWECRQPSAGVEAGWCPVSTTNGLPVSGTVTANSSVTAIAALPTLAPGAQSPQASLAGAQYSQPVFGSTAGGGTQVDSTHGLPVAQTTAANLNATVVGTGTFPVQSTQSPSSASTAGVAPAQSTSVETGHVIKNSAGNLYSFNVSADATLAAAQWEVLIFNSATVPASGAVTPVKCYIVPAGGTSVSGAFPTPLYLATGISIAVSTATTCFTKTDSAHGFISAYAQ
jgi:hypothetical protein